MVNHYALIYIILNKYSGISFDIFHFIIIYEISILNLSFIDLGRRRNKVHSLCPLIEMFRINCFAKIEIEW